MIKLPDNVLKALADLHSKLVLCNRLNFCSESFYNLEKTLILNATAHPVSDGCKWSFDDDGYWSSACGSSWAFNDGGPIENKCNFCQKCGGKVVLETAPEVTE